ncbi:probable rRNA maturation factor [Clostridium collagenovorans DSM 3089]|uniref:Endoribonuclease YbeY n=1 Tax=Clostridium collagenovorans DSM 3089 TaxID=1121306 RepID=A0A1M5XQD6_9CLOT|nr:rRNA maturation RNase YbeY [Clostridium collagenovorans]SHI01882.1 probable rRNA maturation factor [Clostridium collagenovorans DSM 3089]
MIYIDDRQDKIKVTEEMVDAIKEIIDYALKEEGVKVDYEVSLIFVDNENIRLINNEQRNIDSVTDVLSFPMLEYPQDEVFKDVYINYEFDDSFYDDGNLVLGDIALSLERAQEQSLEYDHSFIRETCYLIVHSILHLLGYDHMGDDKVMMRKREEEILNKFKISR